MNHSEAASGAKNRHLIQVIVTVRRPTSQRLGIVMAPFKSTMNKALWFSVLLLTGCSFNHFSSGKLDLVTNQKPNRISNLSLDDLSISTYERDGRRLSVARVEGAKANIIADLKIDQDSEIYHSKGLVAFTYNHNGLRIKTINYKGEDLNTDAFTLDEHSKVLISDGIIAFTTDGEARLRSFNLSGEALGTDNFMQNRNSKYYISNNILAFVLDQKLFAFNRVGFPLHLVPNSYEDQTQIYLSNTILAFTQGATEKHLYSFTYDYRALLTQKILVDSATTIQVTDEMVEFNNPATPPANHELQNNARQNIKYLLDGSVR